jgi:hypothetical protein
MNHARRCSLSNRLGIVALPVRAGSRRVGTFGEDVLQQEILNRVKSNL